MQVLPRQPRVRVLEGHRNEERILKHARAGRLRSPQKKKMSGERSRSREGGHQEEDVMNGLIYLVGLIVVIMAVLSLFGLR